MIEKEFYNFKPLSDPIPIAEQKWPEGITPLVHTQTMTYNHGNFIRECIEGILIQKTTFPVQILIHDDDSTDNTAEIVNEYQKNYPNLIKAYYQIENSYTKLDKHERRSEFMNWKKGKYEAFCEGDDYWTDPLKLQKQVDFLEENPGYVLTGGYASQIYEHENFEIFHDKPIHDQNFDFDDRYIHERNPIFALTMLFRYNIIKEFPDIYWKLGGGTRRLYFLLCQHGKGRYIHENYGVYRTHSGGVTFNTKWTTEGKIGKYENYIVASIKWNNYFHGKYDKETKNVLHINGIRIIKLLLSDKKLFEAAKYTDFISINYIERFRYKLPAIFLKYVLGMFVIKKQLICRKLIL